MAFSTSRGSSSRNTERSKWRRWPRRPRVDRAVVEGGDRVGQRVRAALVEGAGHALLHRLAHAALGQRDHRAAGRLGLDGGDAELLGGGDDQRARARSAARRRAASETRPANADVGPAMPAQAARVGPVADDHERQPQAVERLDGEVDALVRHQLAEHDVEVADRPGREARGLDRRVDDVGVAAEVARGCGAASSRSWRCSGRRAGRRSSPTGASAGRPCRRAARCRAPRWSSVSSRAFQA